ncbi:MAG: patatin-like phospholipase family protein [OCS116 cluster bacterium]|nr:patatin-like phospholipase family protein [OCS116 cluster bacterium]
MTNPPLKIGLALGGGGARGLAHIWAIKAIEELGLEVDVIAGTSIGAVIAAAHASGISGNDIADYVDENMRNAGKIAGQIFSAGASELVDLLNPFQPALVNGLKLIEILMPDTFASDFKDLKIPLKVMTANFYEGGEHIITKGDLKLAVAASMAIPAVFTPVIIDQHVYIDGAYANPVPYSAILDECNFSIAINVNGRPIKDKSVKPKLKITAKSKARALAEAEKLQIPNSRDVLYASNQLMQNAIMAEKLKLSAPNIYIDAPIDKFKVMDFHKAQDILKATEPMKDELKRKIAEQLDV